MALLSLHKEGVPQMKAGGWVTVCSQLTQSVRNTGSQVTLSQAGGWKDLTGPRDQAQGKTSGFPHTGPRDCLTVTSVVHAPFLCSQRSWPVFSTPPPHPCPDHRQTGLITPTRPSQEEQKSTQRDRSSLSEAEILQGEGSPCPTHPMSLSDNK